MKTAARPADPSSICWWEPWGTPGTSYGRDADGTMWRRRDGIYTRLVPAAPNKPWAYEEAR